MGRVLSIVISRNRIGVWFNKVRLTNLIQGLRLVIALLIFSKMRWPTLKRLAIGQIAMLSCILAGY